MYRDEISQRKQKSDDFAKQHREKERMYHSMPGAVQKEALHFTL